MKGSITLSITDWFKVGKESYVGMVLIKAKISVCETKTVSCPVTTSTKLIENL